MSIDHTFTLSPNHLHAQCVNVEPLNVSFWFQTLELWNRKPFWCVKGSSLCCRRYYIELFGPFHSHCVHIGTIRSQSLLISRTPKFSRSIKWLLRTQHVFLQVASCYFGFDQLARSEIALGPSSFSDSQTVVSPWYVLLLLIQWLTGMPYWTLYVTAAEEAPGAHNTIPIEFRGVWMIKLGTHA